MWLEMQLKAGQGRHYYLTVLVGGARLRTVYMKSKKQSITMYADT